MKKQYKRMFNLIRPLFVPCEQISKMQLFHRLHAYFLLDKFEQIYQQDCNCSGKWSFFDFGDRFQRFAQAMVDDGYWIKIKSGTYAVVTY